jgi:hypothetical protein
MNNKQACETSQSQTQITAAVLSQATLCTTRASTHTPTPRRWELYQSLCLNTHPNSWAPYTPSKPPGLPEEVYMYIYASARLDSCSAWPYICATIEPSESANVTLWNILPRDLGLTLTRSHNLVDRETFNTKITLMNDNCTHVLLD